MPAQSSGATCLVREGRGKRVRERLGHLHALRVAAVHVVAREARVAAQVLVAAEAVPARAARLVQPGDPDAGARLEAPPAAPRRGRRPGGRARSAGAAAGSPPGRCAGRCGTGRTPRRRRGSRLRPASDPRRLRSRSGPSAVTGPGFSRIQACMAPPRAAIQPTRAPKGNGRDRAPQTGP